MVAWLLPIHIGRAVWPSARLSPSLSLSLSSPLLFPRREQARGVRSLANCACPPGTINDIGPVVLATIRRARPPVPLPGFSAFLCLRLSVSLSLSLLRLPSHPRPHPHPPSSSFGRGESVGRLAYESRSTRQLLSLL